jgi:glycosyltransferase involved in cell wall biosynthesis
MLIVVDDASVDHPQAVVKAFDNKKIKFIRHTANCGEAVAREYRPSNTSAELSSFLDDDGGWLPKKRREPIGCVFSFGIGRSADI